MKEELRSEVKFLLKTQCHHSKAIIPFATVIGDFTFLLSIHYPLQLKENNKKSILFLKFSIIHFKNSDLLQTSCHFSM